MDKDKDMDKDMDQEDVEEEDEKWDAVSYAKALDKLEEKHSEVCEADSRLRKYLNYLWDEYNKYADGEYCSFLWDFNLPDEKDVMGCLLYAEWAYRAYEASREDMPHAVQGTVSELY